MRVSVVAMGPGAAGEAVAHVVTQHEQSMQATEWLLNVDGTGNSSGATAPWQEDGDGR